VLLVLDISVFVAAILGPGGPSREVVRRCLEEECRPLMSTALLFEYESLLARPGQFDNCQLTASEREELLDALLSVSELVTVYYLWRPNVPDETDNHVVELAISGAAGCIVTSNVRDFRRSELRLPWLNILTPEAFLRSLRP
jgi:putative PIN family toxin of toxin-antitoxin system